jgi:hypothetical protein
LGRLIGSFKTVSTKQLNEILRTPGKIFWQRNYYEHVIRSEKSLNAIRQYIEANPYNWERDPDNPEAFRKQRSVLVIVDAILVKQERFAEAASEPSNGAIPGSGRFEKQSYLGRSTDRAVSRAWRNCRKRTDRCRRPCQHILGGKSTTWALT